jgi:outer membrane protein assembly factor BamE (lipoprotein component of BamABCDE complex)
MILTLFLPDRQTRRHGARMRPILALLLAPLLALAAGCVYRMEIQQGNYVSQAAASQLKLGMTKDQVRFVLGTALLTDIFHEDRWDYVYWRRRANSRDVEERRFTLLFRDGTLNRIEGDVVPTPAWSAGAPQSSQ